MLKRRARILMIFGALAASLVVPMVAQACSVIFEPPKPLNIKQTDLRFTGIHTSTRESWGLGGEWAASRPFLNQSINLKGWKPDRVVNASFRQQRSLKLSARWRENGAVAADDRDPATPACAIAGQRLWSAPKLLVRETATTIIVTSVSRRAIGSREGCVFSSTSCDDRRTAFVKLTSPVGDRRILRSTFA